VYRRPRADDETPRTIRIRSPSGSATGDDRARCVALTKSLGLLLADVDLRQDADGEWWCFEVNTAPGFIWFEQQTGLPIADTISQTLIARPT